MSIETYGTGERLAVAARYLRPLSVCRHIVLLPVPTTRDGSHICGTEILLSETLVNVSVGSIVSGYNLSPLYKESVLERGAYLLDLSENEDFLLKNALVTADGALGYILTTEKRAPRDIRFGIVGYGRIGARITELLLFLGAFVRVYSTREALCLALSESGVDTALVERGGGISDFSDIDVLINTAPTDMKKSFPGGIPFGKRVIELASGDNFHGIDGVEKLPALPERVYPESAGRIYFSALAYFIKEIEATK